MLYLGIINQIREEEIAAAGWRAGDKSAWDLNPFACQI